MKDGNHNYLVSIIIVTWNSRGYLGTCLDHLLKQSLRNFEIIIVDNGSEDGGLDDLQEKYSGLDLQIHKLHSNLGFAVANNFGARVACGQWLALLNGDAFPEPDWLFQLLNAAEKNPGYNFFASRQIQAKSPELLDGAGDEYHASGLAWRKYYNRPVKDYGDEMEEVFSACAAASLYLRDDFLNVGGFDEDYFSYFEDVDLSFRLRLSGGKCMYVPQAIVHHIGSASSGKVSDFVIYYGHRNLVWTYLKNMPGILFWLYLPLHLSMNIYFMISFALKGKGRTISYAKRDAFYGITRTLAKRRLVQNNRVASVLEIYRKMNRGLLDPYWASRQRGRSINKINE